MSLVFKTIQTEGIAELSYLIGPSAAWLPENHLASFAIVAVVVLAITAAAVRGLDFHRSRLA